MTTSTINGHDHAAGRVTTGEQGVRAHANRGDHPENGAQGRESGRNPMYTRAIPQDSINSKTHTIKSFLRAHVDDAQTSLTQGWAMSYQLPTGADVLRQLKPTSRWYAWPVDVPANLLTLAVIVLTYLAVNALGTQRRRRLALALVLAASAVPTLTRLLA